MEAPSKIELKVGEKYTFRLKGLGAAGYNWDYTVEKNFKAVTVSLEFVDDLKKTEKKGPLPPGYSLDVLVTVQALEPGYAKIHFAQSRSWEKNRPPLKEHFLEIFVNNLH